LNRAFAVKLVVVVALVALASAARTAAASATNEAFSSGVVVQAVSPAVDGAMLLEMRCSVCHSANKPRKMKKTLEQWGVTVTRMIKRGSKLTVVEKQALLDYLAKTYGR